MRLQIDLFRKNGMGNVRDLAVAMSTQVAMLRYLDNNQNRRTSPNQNFARELMELFLLGVGNYTEADVEAGAAAWTGHSDQWDDKVAPVPLAADVARQLGQVVPRRLDQQRRGPHPARSGDDPRDARHRQGPGGREQHRQSWTVDTRGGRRVPLPEAVDGVRHRHRTAHRRRHGHARRVADQWVRGASVDPGDAHAPRLLHRRRQDGARALAGGVRRRAAGARRATGRPPPT